MATLRQSGVEVECLDDRSCRESLAGYLARAELGRPHVTLKLAVSHDGFIALGDGKPVPITGEVARAHVHRERARADAILVGGGTLRADAPALDVRLPGIEDRSPERWVLTRGEAPAGWQALHAPEGIAAMEGVQYLYVEGGAQVAEAFLGAGLVDRLTIYRSPDELGGGLAAFGPLGPATPEVIASGWRMVDRRPLGRDMLEVYEPNGKEGA